MSNNPLAATTSATSTTLSHLRWREILVLQGTPLFGAACALRQVTRHTALILIVLVAANLALLAHVFTFNDWAGFGTDQRDPRRAQAVLIHDRTRRRMGLLALGFFGLSSGLLAVFGPATLAIGLAIILLSAVYSAPSMAAKGVPVLSSTLHLAGGVLHFLLGYTLFRAVDGRGVALGCFAALAFVAGHLTQEVRDHEVDRLNQIATNAVRFGKRPVFVASVAIFLLGYLELALLAALDVVPRPLAFVLALIPVHLFWSREALRADLSFAAVCRVQIRYRVLYAAIGIAVAVAVLSPG